MIGFEPYKGRRIDPDRRVRVYRNLMRTGAVWYSVMQGGVVVGHAREIALERATFVVREAGRLRCLRDKRKNVHAFVDGYVVESIPAVEQAGERRAVRYNPYRVATFEVADAVGSEWQPLRSARVAELGPDGCRAFGV